jgi:hypothetical protein
MDGQHLLAVNFRKIRDKKKQWAKHMPLDSIMLIMKAQLQFVNHERNKP